MLNQSAPYFRLCSPYTLSRQEKNEKKTRRNLFAKHNFPSISSSENSLFPPFKERTELSFQYSSPSSSILFKYKFF